MNMKKALAAVLAVVIAISAMAVSVFAVDAVVYAENEIRLIKQDPIKSNTTVTYKFELPVYGQYGYLTDSNYMKVTLPASLDYFYSTRSEAAKINWSVEVNGLVYDLKDYDGDAIKPNAGWNADPAQYVTFDQYVNFGAIPHSYFESKREDAELDKVWATLPQSQMVGEITSVTFVATITLAKDDPAAWYLYESLADIISYYGKGGKAAFAVQMFDSLGTAKDYDDLVDDTIVSGSYVESMTMTKNFDTITAHDNTKNLFLSYVMSENDETGLAKAHLLTWDHNLANRAKVMGTTTAKVVIETLEDIKGFGFYNLYAVYQNPEEDHYDTADGNNTWWDISSINTKLTRVSSSITVTAPTKTLEFEIDPETLYDTNYGVFNKGFVVGYVGVPSYNNADYEGEEWYNSVYWPYLGVNVESWKTPVDNTKYNPSVLKAYILVDAVEEEVVTPDAPLEGGDVEVDEDVEVEENPATGLVLAVLPMVIAAAAVVIFKR